MTDVSKKTLILSQKIAKVPGSTSISIPEKDIAVGKLSIALSILCEVHGIKLPSGAAMGIIASLIIQHYPKLRFQEVGKAFDLASSQRGSYSLKSDEWKPLSITICHMVLRAYLKEKSREVKSNAVLEQISEKNYVPCPDKYSKFVVKAVKGDIIHRHIPGERLSDKTGIIGFICKSCNQKIYF